MRAILLGWPIWLVLIALLSTRAADAAVAPKRAPIGAGSKAAASPRPTAKPTPRPPAVDRRVFNLGGLIVNVYGLSLLAPVVNGSTPDINVLIHMHGRTRSAMLEEPLVKTLYGNVREQMTANPSGSKNDFLVVSFDAPNHGNRTTLPLGQRGYNAGNMQFAFDQYAMIVGDAADATFVADFLPFNLFPKGERRITNWIISGRSMGGHAAYHVLANDARFTIGTVFIGAPDYYKLLVGRTAENNIPFAPPYIPDAFINYVNRTDPAHKPYNSYNRQANPFWGKKLFAGCGGADPLVHFSYSSEFLQNVVLGPRNDDETAQSLEIHVQPNVPHEVTSESTYTKETDLSVGIGRALGVSLGDRQTA